MEKRKVCGTIIVVAWNQIQDCRECVETIRKYYPEQQLIFVDNSSVDGTREWLEQQSYEYIVFDEGIQEYGKALNAVLENFEVGENLILLDPKCRLGKETIHKMYDSLEKIPRAGVVGCRFNAYAPEQKSIVDSLQRVYEVENKEMEAWDYQVIGCVGGCFALHRSLVSELGSFDERLAVMEDVLLDYQLRAIQEGYINLICRNAYVYVEEGDRNAYIEALKNIDRDFLKKKWRMNYFNISANQRFVNLIKRQKEEHFSVLEIGCDMGANLLGIKNIYPKCDIMGLEINDKAVTIGKNMVNIQLGNIEAEEISFDQRFDYIIFGDVLEHLHNPQNVIEYCRKILKKDGRILASIPNLMHITVMQQLLCGEFEYTDTGLLDKTHIHFFTAKEIVKMFEQTGYILEELSGVCYPLTDKEKRLEQELLKISTDVTADMYEIYQYTVVARML